MTAASSWLEMLAAALAGGGAKGAFDYLRSRGRQQIDEREQLAESTIAHLQRLDAEIRDVRAELRAERALRVDAEKRAEVAETELAAVILVNEAMRAELRLMRTALVGSESERIEALIELGKRTQRERSASEQREDASPTDATAPHKTAKP